jgi:hypothetical protein
LLIRRRIDYASPYENDLSPDLGGFTWVRLRRCAKDEPG